MRTIFLFIFVVMSLISGAQAEPSQAILKPGIRVQLICEEEPSMNREYTVTQDGLIVLSFIGAVEIGGLDEKQAATKISEKLVKERILKKATVTLKVLDGAGLPIKFSGAVKLSGETPFREGMKLSDVMAVAEPTQAADLTAVRVTDAIGKITTVDATNLSVNDPVLRPGDRIEFLLRERAAEVIILGGLMKPGMIKLDESMTVAMAIERAGGIAPNGDKSAIVLERAGGEKITLQVSDHATTILQPGDTLRVPIIERRYVSVEGGVVRPGLVPYDEALTLAGAVGSAGGE